MTLPQNRINWNLRLLCLKCRIHKILLRITGSSKNVYVTDRIPLYKEIWQNAASELSAQFHEISEGIWEVAYNGHATRIALYMVQLDDPVTLALAGNKPLCYSLMEKIQVPFPDHIVFNLASLDKALRFMAETQGLFVVKPASNTSAGRGVTTHIASFQECRKAVALASLYDDQIILERLIPGELYRLLFLNGEMIHALRRRGLRVKGDGKSTVSQLAVKCIDNSSEIEDNISAKVLTSDRDYQSTLKAQGLNGDDVPESGQEILAKSYQITLESHSELLPTYDEDVTNIIDKSIINQGARAVQILGASFAGVDIVTVDPTVSLEVSGGAIIEINTTPGLHHHYNLINNESSVPPAVKVLKYILQIGS